MSSPSPARRLGAADSRTRARLLDAAQQLLVEEGYAAVTSRRVAARAGLKPQLVHYYFRTMDDLYLEVFRRRAEHDMALFEEALGSAGDSLRALWQLNRDPSAAAFIVEYVALANHRKAIRSEIARYAERFRAAQLEAVGRALEARGVSPKRLPPVVGLLVMTGLSQVLSLEDALGVTSGHEETLAFIDAAIDRLEGGVPAGRVRPEAT